jgi:hypothetical protein
MVLLYFAMCARAHSLEQKICELLREETVTASRAETNAPHEKQRTMSALTAARADILARISFTSLIVPRRWWLNRAIAFNTYTMKAKTKRARTNLKMKPNLPPHLTILGCSGPWLSVVLGF